MKRVEFHPDAQAELLEAAIYIQNKRVGYDELFELAINSTVETIVAFPKSGKSVNGVRSFLLKGFSYCLIYEVFDDLVYIYAVAHTSRRPGYWQSRLDAAE